LSPDCTSLVRMKTYTSKNELISHLLPFRSEEKQIGFVPTMGALHEGHLSLIERATENCDEVVVSIFVNPTQFNNADDFAKYPNTLAQDLLLLSQFENLSVFAPSVNEIYPDKDVFEPISLGILNEIMEGAYRPGHFQGVAHVVRNLFNIVKPHFAYFGMKDFQQLGVVRKLVDQLKMNVTIVACPTQRSKEGLALSSRNLRLNHKEKEEALIIYETLTKIREWKFNHSPFETKIKAKEYFSTGNLKLEYLEIVDGFSFEPLEDMWSDYPVCCIAAYCGEVRLIDNMTC